MIVALFKRTQTSHLLIAVASGCSLDNTSTAPGAGEETSVECTAFEVRARRVDVAGRCRWPVQRFEVCFPNDEPGGDDGEHWAERNDECWVFPSGAIPVGWSLVSIREPGACGSVIMTALSTCVCEAGVCDGGSVNAQ